MEQVREAAIKKLAAQKGAKYENSYGCGFARYASAISCYRCYRRGLHRCREKLIDNFPAKYLLADRAYDTEAILEKAIKSGMIPVIPPKKNRKALRDYDKYIYRLRHLVKNAFLHLKKWRGIATRYAKNVASFVAAVQIRCVSLLTKIY